MAELDPRLAKSLQRERAPQAMALVGRSDQSLEDQAILWAQARLCESRSGEGCGECGTCVRVKKRQSESVFWLENEREKILLDDAADVSRFFQLRLLGKARIAVIPRAQRLTPQSTNSLLKLVEEPPPDSHFLFLIDDLSGLLPTLRSRLQIFRLKAEALAPLDPEVSAHVTQWLKSLSSSYNVDSWSEFVGDRQSAMTWIEVTARILRDWTVADVSDWPELPHFERIELWRQTQMSLNDLRGFVDKSLVLENFALNWHRAFATKVGK